MTDTMACACNNQPPHDPHHQKPITNEPSCTCPGPMHEGDCAQAQWNRWNDAMVDWESMYNDAVATMTEMNPTQPMRIRYMTLPAHTDPVRRPFLLIIDRVPIDIHEAVQEKADELAEQSGAEAVMVFTHEIEIGTPDL